MENLKKSIFHPNTEKALSLDAETSFFLQYMLHDGYNVNDIKIELNYYPNVFIPESDKTYISFISNKSELVPFTKTNQNSKIDKNSDNLYVSYTALTLSAENNNNNNITKNIVVSIDFSSKSNDIFDRWHISSSFIKVKQNNNNKKQNKQKEDKPKTKNEDTMNPFKLTIKNECGQPLASYYDDSDDGKLIFTLKHKERQSVNTDKNHRFYFTPPDDKNNILFDFVMEERYNGGKLIVNRRSLIFIEPDTKKQITIKQRNFDKLPPLNDDTETIVDREECDESKGSCSVIEDEETRYQELSKMRISQIKYILLEYIAAYYDSLSDKELRKDFNYKKYIEKAEYINAVIELEKRFNVKPQTEEKHKLEKKTKNTKRTKKDKKSKTKNPNKSEKTRKTKTQKKKEDDEETNKSESEPKEKYKGTYLGQYVAGEFNLFLFCLIVSTIRTCYQIYMIIVSGAENGDCSNEQWWGLADCIIELSLYTYVHIYAADEIFSLYIVHIVPLYNLQWTLFTYLQYDELFGEYFDSFIHKKYAKCTSLTKHQQKLFIVSGYVRNNSYLNVKNMSLLIKLFYDTNKIKYDINYHIATAADKRDNFLKYSEKIYAVLYGLMCCGTPILIYCFNDYGYFENILYFSLCGWIVLIIMHLLFCWIYYDGSIFNKNHMNNRDEYVVLSQIEKKVLDNKNDLIDLRHSFGHLGSMFSRIGRGGALSDDDEDEKSAAQIEKEKEKKIILRKKRKVRNKKNKYLIWIAIGIVALNIWGLVNVLSFLSIIKVDFILCFWVKFWIYNVVLMLQALM